MFPKLSRKSFIYDITDIFCFPKKKNQQHIQKIFDREGFDLSDTNRHR